MRMLGHTFAKSFDWTGRARRLEYWTFILVIWALELVARGVAGASEAGGTTAIGAGIFMLILFVGTLVPSLGVSVRRLHDTGRSGWWLLIGLVPCLGGIWLLVLFLMPGNDGENMYGLDPKAQAA